MFKDRPRMVHEYTIWADAIRSFVDGTMDVRGSNENQESHRLEKDLSQYG